MTRHFVNGTQNREGNTLNAIITCCAIVFASVYLELFLESVNTENQVGLLYRNPSLNTFARLGILLAFFAAISFVIRVLPKSFFRFVYCKRWPITLAIIVLLVLLNVNFSSIDMWSSLLPENDSSGLLWGTARAIRSDSYSVSTLEQLSQEANGYGPINSFFRGFETDMRLVYSTTSWSLVTIFRPFQWGYLLFGYERGLSFSWIASFALLFTTTFDFASLFLKKKNGALLFALFITFSPVLLWWSQSSIILYGELLVLGLNKFLYSRSHLRRMWCSLLIAWLCGCYLFVLYPAWMVPFFYIYAVIGIIQIVNFVSSVRQGATVNTFKAPDFAALFIALVFVVLGMSKVLNDSAEAIYASSATVYPGARFSTGGGMVSLLVNYGEPLFYAISDAGVSNNCEMATFFSFFPLGMLLAAFGMWFTRDKQYLPLLILQLLFVLFCVFGCPALVAKLTLMSNVPAGRLSLPIGYLELLLFFIGAERVGVYLNTHRGVSKNKLVINGSILLLSAALTIFLVYVSTIYDFGYFRILFISELFLFVLALVFLLYRLIISQPRLNVNLVLLLGACLFVVPGICINPIQVGASVVTDTALASEVKAITASDNEGRWVVANDWRIANLCAAYGAKTVNSTNAYPNIELWESLGLKESSDIYNRYAHITIEITDKSTYLELIAEDAFKAVFNPNDLLQIGVKYFVSSDDYDGVVIDGVKFKKISTANGYTIYEIESMIQESAANQ